MTSLSYVVAAVVYTSTIILTRKLFGLHALSFALNSFSPQDPIALVSFLAFGTSVLASFPLVFLNMRNWFISQAEQSKALTKIGVSNIKAMSAILLTFISGIACLCNDIGVVGSLAGAIFGSSMMFIFPPIMYIGALLQRERRKQSEGNPFDRKMTLGTKMTVAINSVLLLAGLLVGGMGTYNSLLSLRK